MFNYSIKKIGLLCLPFLFLLSSATESDIETAPVAQLYQQAEVAYSNHNYQVAIAFYQRIRQHHFQTPYAEKAHLGIIQSHIDARQFKKAKTEFATFRRTYPKTEYFNYLLELQHQLHTANTGWITWSNTGKFMVGFSITMQILKAIKIVR